MKDNPTLLAVGDVIADERRARLSAERELAADLARLRERLEDHGNLIESKLQLALRDLVTAAVAELAPKDGEPGAPGADAYAGQARGLHDPSASYRALDIVSMNGCEWRAIRDNPGPLPGDGCDARRQARPQRRQRRPRLSWKRRRRHKGYIPRQRRFCCGAHRRPAARIHARGRGMTVKVLTSDTTTLPTALLPLAKTHLRVVDSDDDAFITSILARSIANFQNRNNVMINATSVLWTPSTTEFINGVATIPVIPVKTFTADAGGDVSANYSVELKWNAITGVPIQVLRGAYANALAVTLTVGMASLAELGADILDVVLRYAGHLYEHREILIIGAQTYAEPDLRLDATFWVPRV